jgi:flagellar hook-length control protein FliK
MNLTSYLQVPPAPLPTASSTNTAQQAARVGTSTSTGASLGFDFAQAMADQLQRLVPLQRQTIAADTPMGQDQPSSQQDTPPAAQDNNSERLSQTSNDASNSAELSQDNTDNTTGSHPHQRARSVAQKSASNELSQPQVNLPLATTVPLVNATVTATAILGTTNSLNATSASQASTVSTPNTTAIGSNTPLQMIDLSPQVRIITNPKMAPSPESLAAFAKSMGLDDSAIHNLLGASSTSQPATAATAVANLNLTTATALAGTSTGVTTNSLQLSSSTTQNLMPNANNAMPSNDSNVATQLAAMNTTAGITTTATPAGLATSPATTNGVAANTQLALGMTAADMASIQQLQITVMPAAVAQPVAPNLSNSPMPSTLSMLSLLGTGTSEQDVNTLLTSFSEDASNESNAQQQTSQGETGNFSGMSQPLTNSAPTNTATTEGATKTSTNMSDVYDQLSGKMATELAARMHKQLSDGEWKMKFALRPSNLGGVEIQLEMKDGKLDAVFRADNPLTRDLLQNSSQRLREALGNFGINPGQVQIGQGGGNSSQNNSGQTAQQPQFRDNSAVKVSNSDDAAGVTPTSTSNKADAALLDLYA